MFCIDETSKETIMSSRKRTLLKKEHENRD